MKPRTSLVVVAAVAVASTTAGYAAASRIHSPAERLADASDTRTILEIAWDCGFTAKSTFNAAFKRQTGQTPSAWRQRHAGGG